MQARIKYVQQALNRQNRNAGPEDGLMGQKTREALNTVIGLPKSWNDNRKVNGCIQLIALQNGLSTGGIDGYWGAHSIQAFDDLLHMEASGTLPAPWRANEVVTGSEVLQSSSQNWPIETEDELFKFYGPVGRNQTHIQLPYPHVLAWQTDKVLNSFSCHEKVHDSLLRVLTHVLEHYGPEQIKALGLDMFGGCLNVRQIRGGTRHSTHSWGIALDYDPSRNKLRWGKDRAELAKPVYEQWWKFWEEEGWVSLGRLKNYDWMHVQAARR